jgi:hypothetical protein
LVVGEREHLHPCSDLDGEGDEGEPDPILIETVQRKVLEAGVFQDADPVFAACPAPVPQFQIGQLSTFGVGDERGQPQPVTVGEAQLCTGVWAFFADRDSHPVGPARQLEQTGYLRHPGAVAGLPVGVVGGDPSVFGKGVDGGDDGVGETESDRVRQLLCGQVVDEGMGAAGRVGSDQYHSGEWQAGAYEVVHV